MSLYRGSETEDSIWRVLSPNHCFTLDNITLFRLFLPFQFPYREWQIQFGISRKHIIFLAWKKGSKSIPNYMPKMTAQLM